MQILLDMAECCNAASLCCHPLTILSPLGNQMWPRVPWLPVSPVVSSRQMNQNRTYRHKSLPAVFAFEKSFADWFWNQNCYSFLSFQSSKDALVSLVPRRISGLSPEGADIMRSSMLTLPHFNCKRCSLLALWISDGCIMGHAQNLTVHHVCTICHLTIHCM